MVLHQFVHTLTYGDAISSEALTIKRLLNDQRIESEIYTVNTHPKYKSLTRSYKDFQRSNSHAVLLHYSIASPLNELFLTLSNIKRAVLYHNITPAKWFHSYNARVVEDIRKAYSGLEKVISAADIVLGDSSYNLLEIKGLLKQEGKVLPLPLDSKKWEIESNSGITGILKGHSVVNDRRGVNILSVGRIAPNRCLEDVIKCFYFYHHKINNKSRLWLTGSDIDTEIYCFELTELIANLRLQEAVKLTGPVADSELKAFYESSDLYLCMSEHEGFCVPIIEAMHFGLPIIAYDSCAVGETVGKGGLLVTEKKHAQIAEVMDQVLTRSEISSKLKSSANEELARFSLENFKLNLEAQLISPLKVHS